MSQTLYLIDDQPDQLHLLEVYANKCGFQSKKFTRAQDCLEALARGEKPDGIITDLYMPEMNGKELAEYISGSEYSYLPVLMVTSEADGGKLNAVRQAGVCALFDKTIDPNSLRNTLTSALGH